MVNLLKKEYRLGVILIISFSLFILMIDKTSEQIVTYFSGQAFQYVKDPFLKIVYFVILFVTIASLNALHKSENNSDLEKGKAFNSYVNLSVISFFPGWIIHLFFVIRTMKTGGSFIALEEKWWIYYATSFTFVIGFAVAAIVILRPAIHGGKD